jgi:hypothetical protein
VYSFGTVNWLLVKKRSWEGRSEND